MTANTVFNGQPIDSCTKLKNIFLWQQSLILIFKVPQNCKKFTQASILGKIIQLANVLLSVLWIWICLTTGYMFNVVTVNRQLLYLLLEHFAITKLHKMWHTANEQNQPSLKYRSWASLQDREKPQRFLMDWCAQGRIPRWSTPLGTSPMCACWHPPG